MKRQVILASQSPRRKELFAMAKIPFTAINPDCEETMDQGVPLERAIEQLAYQKAMAIRKRHPQAVIVGADTIVALNDKVLGKPKDRNEAIEMLKMLSGQTHRVITGVAVISDEETTLFHSTTQVEFYDLSEEEIVAYVDTQEPNDKAGAYAIQGNGALLIRRIEGDYYTVIGLPIAEVHRILRKYF